MSPNVDYEKTSYSTFERIFYLVFIPVIFSLLLTVMLLYIFGVNVKDTAITVGNKIPIVQNWVPDPIDKTNLDSNGDEGEQLNEHHLNRLLELETQLAFEIVRSEQNEAYIAELQDLISAYETDAAARLQSEEEYQAGIKQLANIYASMTPSKAAEIIQNLTLNEQVLVLNEMVPNDQTKILEKMNPVTAAQTSIALKDKVLTKDVQIAALQERLALHDGNETVSGLLSNEELALTFASMTPKNAATVLLDMLEISDAKVVHIMRAMDVQARSRVLNAITDLSSTEAAKLSAKLG